MARPIDSNKFKGIKPITPYQRIAEQYQPVEERQQTEAETSTPVEQRPTRRFIALRNLINTLKQEYKIERADYFSAEQEIRQIGIKTITNNLTTLLSELELSHDATIQLGSHIEDHMPLLRLSNDSPFSHLDRSIYTTVEQGLKVLSFTLTELSIPIIDFSCIALAERCQKGQISATRNNLFMTVKTSNSHEPTAQHRKDLLLSLSVPVGVIEVDQTGRRAFLYHKADQTFALYADKQINIEI